MADINIRKINDAAIARINQLAEDKKISREAYLRKYIESLSVLDDMIDLDLKYRNLVQEMAAIIQNNTDELAAMRKILEGKI